MNGRPVDTGQRRGGGTPARPADIADLRVALNQLDPVDREIVVLRIWGRLSWQEIADTVSIGRTSAQRMLFLELESITSNLGTGSMSEEPRLPEDLMALEARLAARSLPPVALERDDVLYRAGWAAATAAARIAAVVKALPRGSPGPSVPPWLRPCWR